MKNKLSLSPLELQKSTLTLLDHPQATTDDRNRSAFTTIIITHVKFNAQP
ncbi:hypothetical protein [Rudanella paleaurantiibacter]|nr:hypothetical protein [Rudanella paleaurantiibacter]